MKNINRSLLALLLVVLIFGCSGCWFFDSPEADMLNYALEQQKANNKDPQTAGGAGNIIKEQITGTTGDIEADAALGIIKLLEKAKKANAIMEQARKDRSNEGMLAAIDMFPKDWTFRNSKYILSLEKNVVIDADRQKMLADQYAKIIPGSYEKLLSIRIDEFLGVIRNRENTEVKYGKNIIPGMTGSNLYGGLADAYKARYDKYKRPDDLSQMEYYKTKAAEAYKTTDF